MAELGGESGESSAESEREAQKNRPREVCRYKPGFWLASDFEPALLADITNYPAEIREDVLASVVNVTGTRVHGLEPCCCAPCLRETLATAFGFREAQQPTEGVAASSILPRFFWYKLELLRSYGAAAIVAEETGPPCLESDDEDDEIMEDEGCCDDEEMPSAPPVPSEETGVDITDDVVKSKRKRVTVIRQDQPAAQAEVAGALPSGLKSAADSHTDSFSAAIRDLQFRLNRHGFLADPRTFLGRGRGEEMYDRNDSLFDEDECVPILESEESSSDDLENGGLALRTDSDEDDMGLMYQEGEHLFVMDDESEEEEEQVLFASRNTAGTKKPRVLLQCQFTKPANLPSAYNPKGWRQAVRKLPDPASFPKILRTFLHTLEYVVSHKRTQMLQRQIYETFEFVSVEDLSNPATLKLNDFAREQLAVVTNLIFQTAAISFLLPHTPKYNVLNSRFLRYLKPPERAANLPAEGAAPQPAPGEPEELFPLGQPLAALLREIVTRYVSTWLPSDLEYYKCIWIAICEHVVAVCEDREECWLEHLADVFDSAVITEPALGTMSPIVFAEAFLADAPTAARLLDHRNSYRLFAAIEQKKFCLQAMRQDEVNEELIRGLLDDLLGTLTKTQRSAVLSSLKDDGGFAATYEAVVALDWSELAAALFVAGLKSWCLLRAETLAPPRDNGTSPTSCPVPDDVAPVGPTPKIVDAGDTSALDNRLPELDACTAHVAAVLKTLPYEFPADLKPVSAVVTAKSTQLSVLDFFKAADCGGTDGGASTTGMKRRREATVLERSGSLPEADRTDVAGARSACTAGEGGSVENVEKKKRTRVLVSDILQTHFTRIIDLLQASPLPLPIPFGIAVQCLKHPAPDQGLQYTSHMLVVLLHKFDSVSAIELEVVHFDPPLPETGLQEFFEVLGVTQTPSLFAAIPRLAALADFLDQIHSCKSLSVEGRSRSLVFAGFDSRTKCFSLLCFPLAYPHVTCNSGPGESIKSIQGSRELIATELKREDFITSESATVRGRLSLLDFLTLQLWLQIYSDIKGTGQTLLLSLVFRNNSGQPEESRVSPALTKALLSGGDIQADWKAVLDRYSFSQLSYLKKWVVHLKRVCSNDASVPPTRVEYKTF